jgi:hypothetical protein
MFHCTITLERSGAIIAELDAARDRIDGPLYTIEGWHPDLGRVVLIEGDEGALLISETPLPEDGDEFQDLALASIADKAGRRAPVHVETAILVPERRSREAWLEHSPAG